MDRLFKGFALLAIFTLVRAPAARAEVEAEEFLPVSAAQELGISDEEQLTFTLSRDAALTEIAAGEAPSPVGATQIQIVGRGIQNRDTGDSVALGCVDQACSQIRTLYFNATTHEATFIGKTFSVQKQNANPSRREIKRTIRQINKSFRIFKRTDPKVQGRRGKAIGLFGVCMFFCGMIAPLVITHGAIATAAWGISLTLGGFAFGGVAMLLLFNKPLLGSAGMVSHVFADQNGWNWEDQPKRVSPATFSLFTRFTKQE